MKQVEKEAKGTLKRKCTSSPPPPPPPPRYRALTQSVTKVEIAKFWRQKSLVEEDHLLAAIKAAARIRARNLSEEDYKQFEESLLDENCKEGANTKKDDSEDNRVGIKDWWTKSKYAYLNQPAIESMDAPKHKSTYIPNFCFYKAPTSLSTSLYRVF